MRYTCLLLITLIYGCTSPENQPVSPTVSSDTNWSYYGGPVVTAGGLVFIAATVDAKIRAFHKRTGELLWEGDLPAAGFATPAVYALDGREYVVITCGGGKLGTKAGNGYVAFGLNRISD